MNSLYGYGHSSLILFSTLIVCTSKLICCMSVVIFTFVNMKRKCKFIHFMIALSIKYILCVRIKFYLPLPKFDAKMPDTVFTYATLFGDSNLFLVYVLCRFRFPYKSHLMRAEEQFDQNVILITNIQRIDLNNI